MMEYACTHPAVRLVDISVDVFANGGAKVGTEDAMVAGALFQERFTVLLVACEPAFLPEVGTDVCTSYLAGKAFWQEGAAFAYEDGLYIFSREAVGGEFRFFVGEVRAGTRPLGPAYVVDVHKVMVAVGDDMPNAIAAALQRRGYGLRWVKE